MDHSVQGYIARQSPETLLDFLRERVEKGDFHNYRRAVADILDDLASRQVQIPPDIMHAWYGFLSEKP